MSGAILASSVAHAPTDLSYFPLLGMAIEFHLFFLFTNGAPPRWDPSMLIYKYDLHLQSDTPKGVSFVLLTLQSSIVS